jgi:hypothetical protein
MPYLEKFKSSIFFLEKSKSIFIKKSLDDFEKCIKQCIQALILCGKQFQFNCKRCQKGKINKQQAMLDKI